MLYAELGLAHGGGTVAFDIESFAIVVKTFGDLVFYGSG